MPEPDRSLRTLLHTDAATAPDVVALRLPDSTSWTFGELDVAAAAVAGSIPPDARIGVRLGNDAASVVAIHAVLRRGGTIISVGRSVPDAEVSRRLVETGASSLLDPAPAGLDVDCTPLPIVAAPQRADDEALIMFTSGTTGTAKAAAISALALEASVRGIATGSGLAAVGRPPRDPARSPQPVFVPIAHMGGLLGTVTSWWLGKPVLMCPRFSVELVAQIVTQTRIGVLRVTPAMLYELAHTETNLALPGVTSVTVGTAALPERTQNDFEARFGIPVLRNYGQTEFAGAIAFERADDVAAGRRPAGTVGRAAPGVDIRIVASDGRLVAAGEVGEIHARSASAMTGYLGSGSDDGGANDGWLATGDLGRLDDDGFLVIAGRVREMILCGGFNIYPAQLEAALNRLDDVVDSAVAALPDDRLGEIPVAVVVASDGAAIDVEDVRSRLREQMAAYELPRHLLQVSAIPRFDSGKVDRSAVAQLFSTVSR